MDEGELRVIIGPNGAGKSTMLDLITGRTRPDKGKIEYRPRHGLDPPERISDQSPRHRAQISNPVRLRLTTPYLKTCCSP